MIFHIVLILSPLLMIGNRFYFAYINFNIICRFFLKKNITCICFFRGEIIWYYYYCVNNILFNNDVLTLSKKNYLLKYILSSFHIISKKNHLLRKLKHSTCNIVSCVILDISFIRRCKNNFYWLLRKWKRDQIECTFHLIFLWKI